MAATQRMSEDVEAIRTSTSPVRYLSIPELSLARQHSHGQTLGVQNHGVTRFAHKRYYSRVTRLGVSLYAILWAAILSRHPNFSKISVV